MGAMQNKYYLSLFVMFHSLSVSKDKSCSHYNIGNIQEPITLKSVNQIATRQRRFVNLNNHIVRSYRFVIVVTRYVTRRTIKA